MLHKILFLLLSVTTLAANQRYNNSCQQGGKTVIASGVSGAPKVQGSYPQCQVTVFLTGTITLATLFSDNSGTAKANPFTANTDGSFFWYAANGRYDVTLSGGGLPAPVTIGDVLLADPSTVPGGVTSFNGRTGAVVPVTGDYSWTMISTRPIVFASDYVYSQTPGGTVSIGANTVTLTPCPLGVSGGAASLYVYLSLGVGSPTPEAALITGGTCTSGATTGTITFTATVARTGSWIIASAAGGIPEAWRVLTSGGTIFVANGTTQVYQTITGAASNITLASLGQNNSTLQAVSGSAFFAIVSTSSLSGITYDGITFDSNFINTTAAHQFAIQATSANSLTVRNCRIINTGFVNAPSFATPANYSASAGIKCTACNNANIYNNQFWSNWVQDIVGTGDGASIHHNQHGTPNLTEVGTASNYWDTHAGGLSSVTWSLSKGVTITNEQIWGANRFYTPSFGVGNPILVTALTHSKVDENFISGMTPLPGTCSVTNASASVTCSRPVFDAALDVGMSFECETGVGTLYRVSAVGSTTTATLGVVYAGTTSPTARCRMSVAGDLIQSNGLTDSSISGNTATRSGDMGIDVNMFWDPLTSPATDIPAVRNVVNNNNVSDSMVCGINLALGQVQFNTFTGNNLANNHRGTNTGSGARGEFCLNPTPDNMNYYAQSQNIFTGNLLSDGLGNVTYGFDAEDVSFAMGFIGINIFNGNLWFGTLPTYFADHPIGQSLTPTTVLAPGVAAGTLLSTYAATSNVTAGAQTYTAAQVINGLILRDGGGAVNDVTPTAALLVAAITQPILGTTFNFYLRNTSAGANTITLTAGASVTLSGTMTVTQNNQRSFLCRVTNAAVGSETVTCYSLGTTVF